MKKQYNERKTVFALSYGSINHGTDIEGLSDKDFMVFVEPSTDDLYKGGKTFANVIKGENGEDISIKDIRTLPRELYKANPTYLDILLPKESDIYNDEIWDFIVNNRYRIAASNLIGLYHGLSGMASHKDHSTPKGLAHVVRLIYIRDQVFIHNKSYIDCIKLEGDILQRVLDIKQGKITMTEEEVEKLIAKDPTIRPPKPDTTVFDELNEIIKKVIFKR